MQTNLCLCIYIYYIHYIHYNEHKTSHKQLTFHIFQPSFFQAASASSAFTFPHHHTIIHDTCCINNYINMLSNNNLEQCYIDVLQKIIELIYQHVRVSLLAAACLCTARSLPRRDDVIGWCIIRDNMQLHLRNKKTAVVEIATTFLFL